jgi:hypothetical protein
MVMFTVCQTLGSAEKDVSEKLTHFTDSSCGLASTISGLPLVPFALNFMSDTFTLIVSVPVFCIFSGVVTVAPGLTDKLIGSGEMVRLKSAACTSGAIKPNKSVHASKATGNTRNILPIAGNEKAQFFGGWLDALKITGTYQCDGIGVVACGRCYSCDCSTFFNGYDGPISGTGR